MLGVVIPARNEEDNIESVIRNLLDCNIAAEDIFVMENDSSDKTKIIAEECKVNVHSVKNIGYQTAINEGLKILIKKQYSKFCIVDGDNEIGKDSIRAAINRSQKYEFNVGKRPYIKRFGEKFVNKLINNLYGIEDLMCGVKSGDLKHYNSNNNLEYGIDLFKLKDISQDKISNFHIEVNSRKETRLGNSFIVNMNLIINVLLFIIRK